MATNSHHTLADFQLPKRFARRADASRHDLYHVDIRVSPKNLTPEPGCLPRTDSNLSMYGREEQEDCDDNTAWNSEGEQVPLGNTNGHVNQDADFDEPVDGGNSRSSSHEFGSRIRGFVWLKLPVDE